jgi:hypothetical protein
MRQKHKRIRLGFYTISTTLLVAAIASVLVVTQHGRTEAAPSPKPPRKMAAPSPFSFIGTTGWWQGATNKTSMALFQNSQNCFISVQYNNTGAIAASEAKQQKNQADLTNNGYTITPGPTEMITLQTNTGSQQYGLHQSSVVTPLGADQVEGGQEFGYLQGSKGYVFIEGYCNTAGELPSTIPALQAIKFNEEKS